MLITKPPATTDHPMVRVKDLRKSFGPTVALDGVDLTVEEGQVVAIIGGSGSGKSTLLSCINHLDAPDSGEVWIDGRRVGGPDIPGS